MADVQKLAQMLQELDDAMVTCMKCGMCQAVCPVFSETMREADVTRGKIALLENLAHEMITDPEGVQEKLNKCLLCGSCAANCPSGVQVMDIFLKARAIVNGYMGLSVSKRAILRGLLTKPGLFNSLLGIASKFQGLVTKPASDVIGSSCSSIMSPMLGDRHFMPLAKTPLHKKVKSLNSAPGKAGVKVAFFPGCLTDKIFPRIGEAALKIFAHHGVGVYMPDSQACCGIPSAASGDKQSYDKLVRYNVDLFLKEQFDYLVTPCGTCTATIKEVWPALAGDYPAELKKKIEDIAAKTMDIGAFLVDVVGVKELKNGGGRTVTFHDSCHLKKSLGVTAQPRTLIKANPGCELVEMAECDRCCGSGGSFNLYHYDVSKKIGMRKRDNIVASKADVVSTGCPACMMQISDMLSQAGDEIPVMHPVEIYAETLP